MPTNAKIANMPCEGERLTEPTADSRTPVVFLNPNILSKVVQVGMVRPTGNEAHFQPGSVSLRDQPAEALAALVSEAGALLVCTDTPLGGFDARQFVFDRGIKGASIGSDWFSYRSRVERARAVEAWLQRHGNPPAIVIDRPGTAERRDKSAGGKIVVIEIAEHAQLSGAACRAALEMLRAGHV